MKRFLLLMLCLSGLLACSKDKTEDVPPVPPGSEEIPDKLELKAGDTDFNSLAYTVTAGKDGNEYLHVVYDKSFYDGVVGVFYQPADLLQKDGKRGTGTQSYTVKNGDAYPDGTTIFILGKADYVILAAVCDEKGVIKGEITSVSVTTKEVEYSKAQIVVEQDLDKTTSLALAVKITPDEAVDSYYAVPFEKDDYELNYKDMARPELMKMLLRYSEPLQGVQTKVWDVGIAPNTDYCGVVYGMVGDVPTEIVETVCRSGEPQMALPTIEVTIVPGDGTDGYDPHKSLIVTMKAANASSGYYYFDTKSNYEANLEYGYTDETLPKNYGNPIDSESIVLMLEPEGAVNSHRKLHPDTEYVVIVSVANTEGSVALAKELARTATAPMLPPVESELFTTLQGEWTATMTGRVGGMGGGIEVSFPVTIAAGADEQTAADYRAQNRLVCLGFDYDGALPYFTPEDLMAGKVPGTESYNPWEGNEVAARQDYGPKWFLEIASDGTVSVPADDETLFHYLKNYKNYLIGMSGEGNYYLFGKRFEVEISEDLQTLTVKGYEADGAIYYPSVIYDGYGEYGIDYQGSSDIVLTRKADVARKGATVARTASFRSNRGMKSEPHPVVFQRLSSFARMR